MNRRSIIVLAVTIASLFFIATGSKAQFTEQYAGTFTGVEGPAIK